MPFVRMALPYEMLGHQWSIETQAGICCHDCNVKIEFDPTKDEANQAKHGMSLDLAKAIDLQTAIIQPHTRRAYGEDRFRAYGSIQGRLYMLVFTLRGDRVRPISLRKANRMEVRRYGKDQAQP